MTDHILGTEVNEYVTNRQNAKIIFLQQENEQLQEDVRDLQAALKLNKEALKLAYEQQIQSQKAQAQAISHSSNNNSTMYVHSKEHQQQENMISKLLRENAILSDQVGRLMLERNQAQSKALIQEQIGEEQQNFHSEIILELEEKILELRRIIHDKEYVIQELEKIHPQHEFEGQLVKIREIITPNEQSVKLHTEVQNLKEIIQKLGQENGKLQDNNEQLSEYNKNLQTEIIKMRVVMMNPVNFFKMKDYIYGVNDALVQDDQNVHIQNEFNKELAEHQQHEMQVRHQMQMGSNASNTGRQQSSQQQQQGFTLNSQPNTSTNASQMKVNINQNNNIIQTKAELVDRINQLEGLLQNLRLLYVRETMNNQILVNQMAELQAFNNQLCITNETLINSNKKHQEKMQQQRRELELYKSYYYKYMNFLKNRRKNHNSIGFDKQDSLNPQFLRGINKENKAQVQKAFGKSPQEQQLSKNRNNSGNKQQQQGAVNNEEIGQKGNVIKQSDDKQQSAEHKQMQGAQHHDTSSPKLHSHNNKKLQQKVTQHQQQEEEKEVNVSILEDEQAEEVELPQQIVDLDEANQQQFMKKKNKQSNNEDNALPQSEAHMGMNIEQCKIYLLNLAKDLYMNSNIKTSGLTKNVLRSIGNNKANIVTIFKTKRSLSDPLDYTSESIQMRAAQINQKQMKQQKVNTSNNNNDPNQPLLMQQQVPSNSNLNFGRVLDEQDVEKDNEDKSMKVLRTENNCNASSPFNLDMSGIIEAGKKVVRPGQQNHKKNKITVDISFLSEEGDIAGEIDINMLSGSGKQDLHQQ